MDSYTILDCADPNFLVVGDDSCSTSSSNDGTNCNTTSKSQKKQQRKQEQQVQNDWHLMESFISMVWSSTSTLGDDNDNDENVEGYCSQSNATSENRSCQSNNIASFSSTPIESTNSEPLSSTYPPQYRSPYNNCPGRIKQTRSLIGMKRCLTWRRDDSIIYEEMTSNNNNIRPCSPPPMEAFMTLKPSFSYIITEGR